MNRISFRNIKGSKLEYKDGIPISNDFSTTYPVMNGSVLINFNSPNIRNSEPSIDCIVKFKGTNVSFSGILTSTSPGNPFLPGQDMELSAYKSIRELATEIEKNSSDGVRIKQVKNKVIENVANEILNVIIIHVPVKQIFETLDKNTSNTKEFKKYKQGYKERYKLNLMNSLGYVEVKQQNYKFKTVNASIRIAQQARSMNPYEVVSLIKDNIPAGEQKILQDKIGLKEKDFVDVNKNKFVFLEYKGKDAILAYKKSDGSIIKIIVPKNSIEDFDKALKRYKDYDPLALKGADPEDIDAIYGVNDEGEQDKKEQDVEPEDLDLSIDPTIIKLRQGKELSEEEIQNIFDKYDERYSRILVCDKDSLEKDEIFNLIDKSPSKKLIIGNYEANLNDGKIKNKEIVFFFTKYKMVSGEPLDYRDFLILSNMPRLWNKEIASRNPETAKEYLRVVEENKIKTPEEFLKIIQDGIKQSQKQEVEKTKQSNPIKYLQYKLLNNEEMGDKEIQAVISNNVLASSGLGESYFNAFKDSPLKNKIYQSYKKFLDSGYKNIGPTMKWFILYKLNNDNRVPLLNAEISAISESRELSSNDNLWRVYGKSLLGYYSQSRDKESMSQEFKSRAQKILDSQNKK
jgi:hypothetical protein